MLRMRVMFVDKFVDNFVDNLVDNFVDNLVDNLVDHLVDNFTDNLMDNCMNNSPFDFMQQRSVGRTLQQALPPNTASAQGCLDISP